jgi:hypothetical protein
VRPGVEREALRERKEARRRLVAEATRPEVDAHPHVTGLVLEHVHVVVARPDRAELVPRVLNHSALRSELRTGDLVEHRVVDLLLRRHAHSERDPALDLRHHALDPADAGEVGRGERSLNGLVAAADVVADSGRRDVPLVGNRAADRLRVARVMVGAEDAVLGIARRHAPSELLEGACIDRAESPDVRFPPHATIFRD